LINAYNLDAVTAQYFFNSQNSDDNYAMFESFNLINKLNELSEKHILFIHGSADGKTNQIKTLIV
jgi:hypothetical protein